MDSFEKRSVFVRVALSLIGAIAVYWFSPANGSGFLFVVIAVALYLWLGVAAFFFELIWDVIAKPGERLQSLVTLGGTVFFMAVMFGFYVLIRDSIGVGTAILYGIGAYFVFSVIRWFRRHTASYYGSLDADEAGDVHRAEGD